MGTVFRNATLVQLDPAWVACGDLRQEAGRITALGADVAAAAGDEIVRCDGAVLMPGLVNGHTHLYAALAAGMPAPARAPRSFHEILRFVWWRLDRAHTLASVRTSGTVGALAAARCGTTTLVDHHASPEAIAGSLGALEEGVAEVGCRGVLCYETTDRNRPGEAAEGLAENERYVRACRRRSDCQFAGIVGAHASFTLSEESLAACVDLARRLGAGVHIHAAEDPVDQRLTRQLAGCGLMERFERHGLVDLPGTILAHGTHFSTAELRRLANHRATVTVAHNPRSNMLNQVGYAPAVQLVGPVMLGTDGIGSNLLGEAQAALLKSNDARLPLPPARLLEMLGESARLASRALEVPLGLLQIGAAADLVLTRYRPATPLAEANLAGHLLFAIGPEHVGDVMIDGHWVLRQSRLVSCDERSIEARAVPVAQALFKRLEALPSHGERGP